MSNLKHIFLKCPLLVKYESAVLQSSGTVFCLHRERQTGLSPSVSLVKNSYEKQVLESNAKLTYYFVHIRLNVLNILIDLLADFIQTTGEFLHSADIGINLKQYILFVYILVKVQ